MSDNAVSHALDTRPLLAELARLLKRLRDEIHPYDLTMTEILDLLTPLYAITDRLDTNDRRPNPGGQLHLIAPPTEATGAPDPAAAP
jgi:hypothetical protein